MRRFECLYPLTLRDFVAEQLGISKKKAKELIDNKQIFVNKQLVWIASHQLRRGDRVEILEDQQKKFEPSLLLWENDEIIAVNKPAGMVVNEDSNSLETQLRRFYHNPNIQAIHRLDKDTSGVVLYAKKETVYAFYRKNWDDVVEKYYLAICQGEIPFHRKTLRNFIENKLALMDVIKLSTGDHYTLIGVKLHTGRKHQIRIQMASIGFPLVGDKLYGPKKIQKRELRQTSQQYLHAYELRGNLPSGESFRIVAPLPEEMKKFMSRHHLIDEVVWETEKWFDSQHTNPHQGEEDDTI